MDETRDYLARIETKLDKMDGKLDVHSEHLASLDVTVAKQEKEISIHIEATRTNKELIELYKSETNLEITPLKRHVVFMQDCWKLLIAVGSIAAILMTFLKLYKGL